jgi:hypothetical protein
VVTGVVVLGSIFGVFNIGLVFRILDEFDLEFGIVMGILGNFCGLEHINTLPVQPIQTSVTQFAKTRSVLKPIVVLK